MEHLTGIIPAGGLGTRLSPHTLEMPKPMLLMGSSDRVVIDSALELVSASCNDVLVSTEYIPEKLEEHVTQRFPDTKILRDPRTVGSAGLLLEHPSVLRQLPVEGNTVFLPADHVHDGFSVSDLALFHSEMNADITMLTVAPKPYGEYVEVDGCEVRGITDMPSEAVRSSTGIFVVKNSHLHEWAQLELERGWSGELRNFYYDIIVPAVGTQFVASFDLPEGAFWDDIGKVERYLENNMRLSLGENVISSEAIIGQGVDLERCVVLGRATLHDLIASDAIISQTAAGELHITESKSVTSAVD